MRAFAKLPSDNSIREMTDEQWLWIYLNYGVDHDETLEGMCPKCREEAVSTRHCSRCGKPIHLVEGSVNPNFDKERFERLSMESDEGGVNPGFDHDRFKELDEDGEK